MVIALKKKVCWIPGSFDVLLNDRDARPAVPTAAQVHYDAVQQLQAQPQPRQDPGANLRRTKNVGTSMARDDFPLRESLVCASLGPDSAKRRRASSEPRKRSDACR